MVVSMGKQEISDLLRRTKVIDGIKEASSSWHLRHCPEFRDFEKHLKPHIEELEDYEALSKLLDEINEEICNQLTSGEDDMLEATAGLTVATKIAIAGGGLLVVGVVIGGIYLAKQQEKQKGHNSDGNQGKPPPPPSYKSHNLLLIVPANRLPQNLANGEAISNNQIHELIGNSVRAYCFVEGDERGKQVMNSVECADTPIDKTTENRVFIQLELLAESVIVNERNKLGIRNKIKPATNGEVLQVKHLESARSTSEFYSI